MEHQAGSTSVVVVLTNPVVELGVDEGIISLSVVDIAGIEGSENVVVDVGMLLLIEVEASESGTSSVLWASIGVLALGFTVVLLVLPIVVVVRMKAFSFCLVKKSLLSVCPIDVAFLAFSVPSSFVVERLKFSTETSSEFWVFFNWMPGMASVTVSCFRHR